MVPIDHELVVELREGPLNESEWPGDEDLVFPATNGQPLRQENVRAARCWNVTAEEAGVAWAGFSHVPAYVRHGRLFAAGRNAVQVQRWLGHHSPAFTLSVYVHLLDGDVGGPLYQSDVVPPTKMVERAAT